MGAQDEIVVFDDQIAHGCDRHVQAQRLPVVPVVYREVHGPLGAGKEQPLPLRILLHRVDGLTRRDAGDDLRPRLPAVARPVDVRVQVVEAERVDRRVRPQRVGVRRVHDGHFCPRRQLRRRHVLPRLAGVTRDLDQPVVGAGPDPVDVEIGRRQRIHDASAGRRRGWRSDVLADARRHGPGFPREVRADLRPARSPVHRLPDHIRREVERVGIDRREHDRLRADDAVVGPALRRPDRPAAPVRCDGRTATRGRRRRCPDRGDPARRSRTPRRRPGSSRETSSRRSSRGSIRTRTRSPAVRRRRGRGTRCRYSRGRTARSAGCTRS